jgi:hypothetical protein
VALAATAEQTGAEVLDAYIAAIVIEVEGAGNTDPRRRRLNREA